MTDPLEDRLRAHLADRAARVTVDPDPNGVYERSAGRRRIGAPVVAGVAALLVVLTGGGFAAGLAVAGPARTPAPGVAAEPTTTTPGGASPSAAAGAPVGGVMIQPALTPLFLRTTGSGVTIRAYESATDGCASSSACPPVAGGYPTAPCPRGTVCALPVTNGVAASGSTGSGAGSSGGNTGTTGSATTTSDSTTPTVVAPPTTTPTTGPATTTTTTTTTVPSTVSACRQLTLELSTARAVTTTSLAAPTTATLGAGTLELLATDSFGGSEGAASGYVTVVTSPDVTTVRLVSPAGAVLDAMAPASGVAVLAATGATALAGTSVVGLDDTGATVATVATDQLLPAPSPGCVTVSPVVPAPTPSTPSTTPGSTVPGSTTGPATTAPGTVPTPVPAVVPSVAATPRSG